MELVSRRGGLQGSEYWRCKQTGLAGEGQEHAVQLHQVGVDAIEAGAPFRIRFFGIHFQHGKVALLPVAVSKIREFVPEISDSARGREMLAIFPVQNSAQHALVLRVGLAKV